MIHEYIKQHPNNGKQIILTDYYYQRRNNIIQQIATIENATKDTLLSGDWDIKKRLLPNLKRSLKRLQNHYGKGEMGINAKCCAQYILDMESEEILDPLQYCRYYDGQTDTQGENVHYLAGYEKGWCEFQRTKNHYGFYVDIITVYICDGLMMFADFDKAPISLKALLYSRYCNWDYGGADEFKYWYSNTYSKEAIR